MPINHMEGNNIAAQPTLPELSPFPFSPSFHPSNDPLLLSHLPPLMPDQSDQVPLDIDWVSLLSGGALKYTCDQQTAGSSSSTVANSSNGGEGGNRGSGGRSKIGRGSRAKKKAVPPRFAFHTRSSEDVLDDGYKWRKYGQKAVKYSTHPRCTYHTCNVKKQIQRLSRDTSIVVTTYEGIHNHPCEKLMETLTPLLKQLQFLSRF
ncbi:WRKY transcription factor [Ancistrocladus abbreviatus]